MASFVQTHKEQYDALTKSVQTPPLKDKVAIITGAGRGVGEHITKSIAAAGKMPKFAVVRSFPHVKFVAFAVDIIDEAAISAAVKELGQADILINNAGQFPDQGPFAKEDLNSWWSGFQVNVLGTGAGGIVFNVSSIAAHLRFPLNSWSGYCGSKMAQARIFEMIKFDHFEVRFINCHPGSIASDGFDRCGASAPPDGMTDGRLAGDFFAWLASDEAEFVSGRFVWAEWDIDELKAKRGQILDQDLLLTTVDGF